jgi:hypothetical protein
MFSPGGSSSSSSKSTFHVDEGSDTFERRYVKERFKQEGYNSSDAAKAADAVIRFHNAQQARQK